MLKLGGLVLHFMPLIFGIGFPAPLITQVIERASVSAFRKSDGAPYKATQPTGGAAL